MMSPAVYGQQQATVPAECRTGSQSVLSGDVEDSTHALIPGALVQVDGGRKVTSGPDGRFHLACVTAGSHTLRVSADGFASKDLKVTAPHAAALSLVMLPETTQEVDVDGGAAEQKSTTTVGPSQTIEGSRLQSLADDPDDLLRELQQLAANAGASPSNVTISVDGFQGSASLPPKSSIAYIKVNPDMFSAEYREPPFDGGRVEVYTKPGQTAFHGALFLTNGSSWMNARDPFSTSKAALGKQRYGFELSGPVRKQGSDFAMTLEHRSIDNYAVVNAVTLDSGGNSVSTVANVATPQRLWLGTARVDWALGTKNTFIASYSANQNHLGNVGVGGAALAQAGYDAGKYDHALRLTDVTTFNAHLMHEARVSLRWDGETDTPVSTAPQLQVAGAFTGGGATLGNRRLQEFNLEADDDAIWTPKHHTVKIGTQFMVYDDHQQLTTNFNGAYTFGGGTAPVLNSNGQATGQTTTITGIEQYRRAILGLPGGTPTAFSNVTGTPTVDFALVKNALYVQDDWDLGHGLHVASGVRWLAETSPTVLSTITPRLGVAWSPDKNGKWTLHAHAGLFSGENDTGTWGEVLRENGVDRITRTAYNPVYAANGITDPYAGTTPIYSQRTYAPGIGNVIFAIENVGGTRTLPGGWNLSVDGYYGRIWNDERSLNINSPLNGVPTGPRAMGIANTNILQVQNSGQGRANVVFMGLEEHKYKHLQMFVGGVHIDLVDDSDDHSTSSPQSAFTNAGEYAQRTGNGAWQIFGNATVTLPEKIQFSSNLQASGDAHYNITTGFDNNGDGNFNDRPQYALPGQTGAVKTPYGLLVASGGTGVFGRNRGVMPWTVYLDSNLQRAFPLTHNKKAEHQQSVLVNVRASNILNHTNVTAVGGVLGSPLFGVPYAADNGRRVEVGLRYSF